MLAQKRHEVRYEVAPRVIRRKRKGLVGLILGNRMLKILMVAVACFSVLTVYVGAHAKVIKQGYEKAYLQSRLKALEIENQELRVQLDILRQPDRITKLAIANGMVPAQQMAYVQCPIRELWVAENTAGYEAR
ncbi:MAG: hypothetical protein QME62_00530 [Armatimonadota bacterium]|nr:hypothetical protein [Armatimonadota bacterium]